jgi:dinuclear metal center YbgI/SA1388 family protein
MQIAEVIAHLEQIAPPALQESYDNSGLLVGESTWEVTGVLVTLDCLESTIEEAVASDCNLIIAHHPIVFSGLKRFNNANYVQRTVQLAIKKDVAIYAIHTNLDNVYSSGVNQQIARKLGLSQTRILAPKEGNIVKLVTYVPKNHKEKVLSALFDAGAGTIGDYAECSFSSLGEGTFKAGEGANPTLGEKGVRHKEVEERLEVVLQKHQKNKVLSALKTAHPYEEVAYELYPTLNTNQYMGSGLVGDLDQEMDAQAFLRYLKNRMELQVIKYTPFSKNIKKVALCGGSGQFLLPNALGAKADVFITSDFKYHQFFDAEERLMICDIGHYESEKYTIDLLYDILTEKFSNFAVLKTRGVTNPIKYFH